MASITVFETCPSNQLNSMAKTPWEKTPVSAKKKDRDTLVFNKFVFLWL